MSSCSSNSSNLSGNVNIQNITGSGARLLMTLPLSGFSGGRLSNYVGDDGVTAGDAVRYDNDTVSVSYTKYVKAQGDSPANSEVIGIVESVSPVSPSDPNSGIAVVVISGQIEYPSSKVVEATHIDPDAGLSGSAGGNDVYFLSAATAGVLQNLAPTEATQVIKPIYQVAPDSPWTGHVVNYIGYQSGGQVVATDFSNMPVGSLASVPDFGGSSNNETREGWVKLGTTLPLSGTETYGYAYANGLGRISTTSIQINLVSAPTSNLAGQTLWMKKSGTRVLSGKITSVSATNKYMIVEFDSTQYTNLANYIVEGNYFNSSNGTLLQISNVAAKYLSFTLPNVSTETSFNNIKLNVNNKETSYGIFYYMFAPLDETPEDSSSYKTHAVAISQDITVKKITVQELIAENDTAKVTDAVEMLNTMQNDIASLKKAMYGSSVDTDNAYLEQK